MISMHVWVGWIRFNSGNSWSDRFWGRTNWFSNSFWSRRIYQSICSIMTNSSWLLMTRCLFVFVAARGRRWRWHCRSCASFSYRTKLRFHNSWSCYRSRRLSMLLRKIDRGWRRTGWRRWCTRRRGGSVGSPWLNRDQNIANRLLNVKGKAEKPLNYRLADWWIEKILVKMRTNCP